jgi:hypothetical protein
MRPVDRRTPPVLPLTTGTASQLIGTTEPKLAETVRRGRIQPSPVVVAGRRLWTAAQVEQAAEALDLLTDQLRARLREEVARD